jgi:hypothetical protein
MIWGADHIFDLPEEVSKPAILAMFGTHGWTLTYDFKRKKNQIAVYTSKLDEAGKQGLLFAKLAWYKVK